MLQREWHIQPCLDPPIELISVVNQDPIAANYLIRQGITSPNQIARYLMPDVKNLSDPFNLPDMKPAVDRIMRALENNEVIGIWGDFDVDGQTSTAILVECLMKLGAKIQFYLPVRGKETHGIAIPYLKLFLEKGIQLLITCDTGITAHEAVQFSNENNVDVIITDHHSLPENLPNAIACINPRRLPDDHPLATLSGSGTAFEVMLAICREYSQEEIAFQSIDLAAIGLIADLAALQNDARLITQLGLQKMTEKPRVCIQAILAAANIKLYAIDEQTVGYIIAPRLNAYGRLGDANPLISFLMDLDPSEIQEIAQNLERVNADRRWLSSQVGQSAVEQYNRQRELWDDPIIVLSNPAWPGGVLGLAANRLVSETNRPTILLNESNDGILRGSARSVEGININEAISSASHLLNGFGGHPMAAGMSLPVDNLVEFRRSLNKWVWHNGLTSPKPAPLEIDAELTIPTISRDWFLNLQRFYPFGIGNPPFVFCLRSVQILSSKALGRTKEHYRYILADDDGNTIPAVWWGADSDHIPTGLFDFAFTLRENNFKGETSLQAEWIDFHLLEESDNQPATLSSLHIQDFRNSVNSLEEAIKKTTKNDYLIFQEPPPLDSEDKVGRLQNRPSKTLILASIPPSAAVMDQVIKHTIPRQVILAFDTPTNPSPQFFLKHLSGLIQYAVANRDGLVNIKDLAEATNARVETIEAAISWLVCAGKINVAAREQDLLEFSIENRPEDPIGKQEAEKTFIYLLRETYAFQKHFHSLTTDEISNLLSGMIKPVRRNT